VIEDAAQPLGLRWMGKPWSWGDTCISFLGNKNLTTGEGGMLLTHKTSWQKNSSACARMA
jgi:dTDP-4-amino-4,6-dideoxygalactose transaminase